MYVSVRLDVAALKSDSSRADRYNVAVSNVFGDLDELPDDVEDAWQSIRRTILSSAEATIPKQISRLLAFDSVDRQALWKALHATGAPEFLIQLIQDLHTGTMSGVRVGKRHSILPQVCGRDVYLPQHYSAWQLTGSCPDALAVLASHSMGQCLLTCTTQMMRYSLHRIKAGGRQNSSVL